ncbi:hypothetical protein QW060_20635 [Myroides ceti]|uniref:Uncharacterized protein n=1 Tax=Paenimyroides ceti TaxID=395087 RepID=A0ABT8CRI5_9FLAO|nr:hypothetical protein [Paenimyroides ceti]MDN3707118.1 hypothetical protein [Paenimyroides ceti]MDN3709419.1 hypothetical protein [Paenimyroides ceti]
MYHDGPIEVSIISLNAFLALSSFFRSAYNSTNLNKYSFLSHLFSTVFTIWPSNTFATLKADTSCLASLANSLAITNKLSV